LRKTFGLWIHRRIGVLAARAWWERNVFERTRRYFGVDVRSFRVIFSKVIAFAIIQNGENVVYTLPTFKRIYRNSNVRPRSILNIFTSGKPIDGEHLLLNRRFLKRKFGTDGGQKRDRYAPKYTSSVVTLWSVKKTPTSGSNLTNHRRRTRVRNVVRACILRNQRSNGRFRNVRCNVSFTECYVGRK